MARLPAADHADKMPEINLRRRTDGRHSADATAHMTGPARRRNISTGCSNTPALLQVGAKEIELFEQLCGEKVRASDAAWVHGLLPAERVAVADDLFVTVRAARVAAGDWQQVDDRAWQETLSDRIHQVRAFRRYDEALRGSSPLADAR